MAKRTSLLLTLLLFNKLLIAQQSVSVSKRPNGYLLISNGTAGVIVPTGNSIKSIDSFLAPIQSFVFADGSESDNEKNYLRSISLPLSAKTDISQTAEGVTFYARYQFKDGGYYSCSITVKKNSKTIIIDEDANTDLNYRVRIGNRTNFDQAQYRGWSSTSQALGREPDGRQYRDESQRTPMDAVLDINYSSPEKYPFMSNWDPAGGEVNTGRYWQLYRKSGSPSSNMFGIFQGQPSRLIGNKFIGVRFVVQPSTPKKDAELSLEMEIVRRGPDNSYVSRKRFQWCVYISAKKDVLPADQFQPIGLEMNKVSGVALKVESYCKKLLQVNESFLKGSIYLDTLSLKNIIQKVKTEEAYYKYLYKTIPSFRASLDAWRFPDSAVSLKRSLLEDLKSIRKDLTKGDGTHSYYLKYWMGSINYKRTAMKIAALFADRSISISTAEKDQLLELMRLMARIHWDDNYVPFFDSSGINFGTANMSYQYRNNGRNFFALLFSNDPEFRSRAAKVLTETRNDLISAIAANGASFASPHYTQATIDPILYNMLQLKQAGIADLFRENRDLLQKFIDFYSSFLTPRSVRFKGYRKLVNFGDGSEESAPTFALLAAGLKDVDSSLSNNLYYIFENGAQRLSLFGELGLAVDLTSHKGSFSGSSANFTGYFSHFRSDVNSNFETAAWILNGEIYSDHRNDDRGETVIYTLGAPLSLSRNSFYSPRAPDARIRSLVVPERLFPSWQSGNQPINGEDKLGNPWESSKIIDFAKLPGLTYSSSMISGKSNIWKRNFILIHEVPEEPIFIYYDSLQKEEATIWSMNFMSDSVLENSSFLVKSKPTLHDGRSKTELPSGSPEKNLKAGWNVFNFKGQRWIKHASGGINWHLYTHTRVPSSYSLARWTTTWQNTEESEEFLATNGRPYEETQDILRWKSSKPFFAIIAPYKKNEQGSALVAKNLKSHSIELANEKRRYVITPSFFTLYEQAGSTTIGIFSSTPTNVEGIQFTGGNINLAMKADSVRIFVGGASGKRTVALPFEVTTVKSDASVLLSGKGKTVIEISHIASPDPGPREKGYKEFLFLRKKQ